MLNYCFGKATTTDSNDSIYQEETNPEPIFINNKLGRIQEGLCFTFTGVLPRQARNFFIDFMLENPNKDVALRIAGSVEKNEVARSSRVKNIWSVEETESATPYSLEAGKPVEIQVLLTVPAFMVAINGFHAAKFNHRLPFHSIERLEVLGDLLNLNVDEKIVTEYPRRPDKSAHIERLGPSPCEAEEDEEQDENEDEEEEPALDMQGRVCVLERCLPLPYYAIFERGFLERGFGIGVKGRITKKPQLFTISMQTGVNIWPPPVVALQLQVKFQLGKDGETGEPTVSRNSFVNNKWTGEISSKLATGLRPGAEFTLSIIRGKKSFEMFINDNPITDYNYKVNPKYVDTVLVSGDLKLFGVEIESQ